jgi:hypothetical protein
MSRRPVAWRSALASTLTAGLLGGACGADVTPPSPLPALAAGQARAFRAERADQLVGGDLAMARVGDFILENDQIRVGILGAESSPAPGVFGGTLVDADLQRPEDRFRGGRGADQLAEVIPVANLLWPRPREGEVVIVADGRDGGPAIIRVTGDGGVFLEALSLLRGDLVELLFPGVRFDLRIQTDYILAPGDRHVRMVSTAFLPEAGAEPPPEALAMPSAEGALPIFGAILGDADAGTAPGLMAGDFLFFGGRNDIFAPGIGFDEEKPIFDALFEGRDTFTHPLAFDFVAAPGGDVSYAYFNPATGPGAPKVLVPIMTSSSTGFVTAALNCSTDAADDATCDRHVAWRWERYLAVGDGDVASVADVVHAVRGTPTGTLAGVVMGKNGNVIPNARVFVMRDPGPEVPLELAALEAANRAAVGHVGLLNALDADPGRDPVEDGAFRATMPPGRYVVFARNPGQTATSALVRVEVRAGETTRLAPIIPLPARVRVRVHDHGAGVDAKLSFVALGADGAPLEADGLRRPWLGEGRLGNGLRHLAAAIRGEATVEVEPGRYHLHVSRGPLWSKAVIPLDLAAGAERNLDVALTREVDARGWVGGDFHLHAEASFDSGMSFTERLRRVLIEGLDVAVATDHDVVSDYGPALRALAAEDRLKTGVGVELSTLELGHFIAFPLAHDARDLPTHGAPDWSCLDGPSIMRDLKGFIEDPRGGTRIMAHPRDGFFGHISQIGLDGVGASRALSTLEANNPLLARTSCDFDAMELFNGKRLDLVRTPTNAEVIRWNRCVASVDAAPDAATLAAACPELSEGGPLASCPDTLPFPDCKARYRRRAAFLAARDILVRTPDEQHANWLHTPDADADAPRCDPAGTAADPDADLPCIHWTGTYDDWMRWLDAGLAVTLTGASDSHGNEREPGWPRTFVRSDAPSAPAIDLGAVARNVTDGRALPSYGPLVDVTVGGRGPGDTASVTGETFELDLRVQTASWFGVDRLEIYVSGRLERVITLDHGPTPVVDFDGRVTLPVPDHDGFVSVVALGTREDNLLGPVVTDVPFGELQLPRVAALAFSAIPAFSLVFTPTPSVPDFFPIFPLAATNAILLDVNGDDRWSPPGPRPLFCERACEPSSPPAESPCDDGEVCLPDGVCGLPIEATCVTGAPGSEERYLHLHD